MHPRRRALAAVALVALLAGAPASAREPYWTEPAFASAPPKGPAAALGLVIWNHGVMGHDPRTGETPPLFVLGLAARGWDVIKLDRDPERETNWADTGERHVERLIAEVAASRARGYRRIILAGQSYGGGIALAAADAVDGLWAVIATAPTTGQAIVGGRITDRRSAEIARDTETQLRSIRPTRLAVVFPKDDPFMTIPRGEAARAVLRAKGGMAFLDIDESAPISGHVGAYSAAFNAYATCVGYFVDPALTPPAGEFRCSHDEFAAVSRTIRAAAPAALAPATARWFGYYAESGQELVLSLHDTAPAPRVEYAWGPGALVRFKPGSVTLPVERHGVTMTLRLANGAKIEAVREADGDLRATYARDGEPPHRAELAAVER